MKKMLRLLINLYLILSFLWIGASLVMAEENIKDNGTVKKVLILPFEVYADKDLSYLKEAIPEMLVSRLFTPNKIEVVDYELVKMELTGLPKINKEIARSLGQKFNADYVVWGSVTVLGESVSIDAQMMSLTSPKKPVQFFQELKGVSEIIPQLTRFAFKSKVYVEGTEEDFYRAEPMYAMSSYGISKEHPERGYYYYYPYLFPPRTGESKPKVTRAKGFTDVDVEESLSKGLVIDVTKGTVGWAEDEETKRKPSSSNQTNATSGYPAPYPGYYPGTPYYPYSPPPYYYYQEEDEGILSKFLSQFPFIKERKEKTPQFYQTQVIQMPQLPPQPYTPTPSPTPSTPPTPSQNLPLPTYQSQPSPANQGYSPQPQALPSQGKMPEQPLKQIPNSQNRTDKNNPWSWD
ncbi:hypothetical protein F1847_08985 [Thermodesulfobacterium sp. TA1]|uniref:hypothetical protein n=1 Tax=Thermodesulfobacterium sp. TA1 TaxID=2234087 RepID=UPI0012323FC0|nr:hypothetical protein [Thermodesulfobacterium sp. TA1]QER42868.1 hypothetical protein F1847_08985 [Thermodesulfobacterium sp. TA1]